METTLAARTSELDYLDGELKRLQAEFRHYQGRPAVPGKPLEIQSRDELLAVEEFGSLREAEVVGAEWRRAYNHDRPHSSLGYKTPAAFGASCPRYDSASLRRTGGTRVTV